MFATSLSAWKFLATVANDFIILSVLCAQNYNICVSTTVYMRLFDLLKSCENVALCHHLLEVHLTKDVKVMAESVKETEDNRA